MTDRERDEIEPVQWKPRIWALWCPFKKNGFPVLGTFGKSEAPIVMMHATTWTRLCNEIPALAAMYFEVGSVE